jgi:hypothetical protein
LGTPIRLQSQSDDDAEGGVDRSQRQEVPAEPLRGVIKGLRGAVQIIRANETDKSVAQITSLEKDENHENDDDRSRGERR